MVLPTNDVVSKMFDSVEKVRAAMENIGHHGLCTFEINSEIWLDPLLKHCTQISDAKFEVRMSGVYFIKTIVMQSIELRVISGPWGIPWKLACPAVPKLEFGVQNTPGIVYLRLPRKIDNPGDGIYREIAEPVEKAALDDFTAGVSARIAAERNVAAQNLRQATANMLEMLEDGFAVCNDIPAVQKYFAEVNTNQPGHSARWLAASQRRTEEILARQQSEQANAEYIALEASEQQRLADQAAALFKPFTVYKLTLGIKYDDENEIRLFDRYVTAAIADEAGWYVQINRGEIISGYRPDAPIIDVHRVEIDTPDHPDAPHVCRHLELASDAIPHLVEHVFATPEGLG